MFDAAAAIRCVAPLPPCAPLRRRRSSVAVVCSPTTTPPRREDEEDEEEVSRDSYNEQIRLRCRAGEVDASMALLARMESRGLSPDEASCAALVSALGAVGRTLEAEGVFRELKWRSPRPPAVGSYNALLRGLLGKGQLGLAEALLAEMQRDGVRRNRETYLLLLDAFARARRLEDAQWVVAEMKKKGFFFRLDSAVYSKLIRLYRDNGMWKKATELVAEMRAAGVRPDRSLYNGAIDALGEHGQTEEMMRAFEAMRRDGVAPNIVTWNSLIRWYCRAGDLDRAMALLGEMQEGAGLYPDPKIFLAVISRLGEQGRWEEIRSVFEGMRRRGFRQSGAVYAVLADIYGQYGTFADAEQCVAALKAEGLQLSANVFCVLANAYAQQVRCLLPPIRHGRASLSPFHGRLTDSLGAQGLCEQTVNVFRLMEAEGIEPNLIMLNSLINAFGIAGRCGEALSIFEHIKEIVSPSERGAPSGYDRRRLPNPAVIGCEGHRPRRGHLQRPHEGFHQSEKT